MAEKKNGKERIDITLHHHQKIMSLQLTNRLNMSQSEIIGRLIEKEYKNQTGKEFI